MRLLHHLSRKRKALLGIVQKFLDDQLLNIYCSPSNGLRAVLLRPAVSLRRLFLLLRSGLELQVYQLEGREANSGQPLRVCYFADGKGLEYIENLLFDKQSVTQQRLGSCHALRAADAAREYARQADLVVIERNTLLKWIPPSGTWVRGPTWVRMVFDFQPGQPWEEVARAFRAHSMNIKRMKRAGFTCQISRDPEDFEFFYQRMHIPLIRQRHAGYGIVDTRENLFRYFQKGFLMFVCNAGGERVAGDLNVLQGDVFMGLANGLLDGDTRWLEEGALSALYYYSIQWCYENRIRRQDLGEVRPFVDNGLYQYKRRWGFRAIPEIWNTREWLFWVPKGSATARHLVEAHPFLPEFCQSGGIALQPAQERQRAPLDQGRQGSATD